MEFSDSPGQIRLNQKTARKIPGSGDNAVFNFLRLQPGILAAGDAAGFILNTGFQVRGMDFALASGTAAAETVLDAHRKGDFSLKAMAAYEAMEVGPIVVQDSSEPFLSWDAVRNLGRVAELAQVDLDDGRVTVLGEEAVVVGPFEGIEKGDEQRAALRQVDFLDQASILEERLSQLGCDIKKEAATIMRGYQRYALAHAFLATLPGRAVITQN